MEKVKWISDPAHSELGFRIRHLMISHVSGAFRRFRVEAETDGEDFTTVSVSLTADVTSVSTANEQRDQHLRSPDFFDADHYPEMTFRSTATERVSGDAFTLHGELTMKGVAKPVSLHVEFGGIIRDAHYGDKAGFTVSGTINRNDWGISLHRVLESGGAGLGVEVKLWSEIQLTRQRVAEAV